LIDYAIKNTVIAGSQVIESLLTSILPVDKEPLRLSTLSKEQKTVNKKLHIRIILCGYWKNTGCRVFCIVSRDKHAFGADVS
jgi:hypothetical protein